MSLEPRIMYDGAAAATVADANHDASSDAASNTAASSHDGINAGVGDATPPPTGTPTENEAGDPSDHDGSADATPLDGDPPSAVRQVVFIDARVGNIPTLIDGLEPGTRAFVLDADSDGVRQIADLLRDNDLRDLQAIQIVSHGGEADMQLGSTHLTSETIADHAGALAEIGASLTAEGDILLYGCEIAGGPSGLQFLSSLSDATGADIAASTDAVGAVASGGNWTLEASTGPIEASAPFNAAALDGYRGLLAPSLSGVQTYTLTTDADGDGVADPGDTVTIAVTVTNSGPDAATNVQLAETLTHLTATTPNVRITPIAFDDAYALTGNTPITISAVNGVLANDIDPDSATPFSNVGLTVTLDSDANVHGTLVLNPDGSFTYTPDAGYEGTATFTYFARDAQNLDSVISGTVTLSVTDPVWYVDSSAAAGGDGTYDNPFQTIAELKAGGAFDGTADANDTIFFYDRGATYSNATGLTLANGVKLYGDSSSLTTVNGLSVGASSSNSALQITGANAMAVTLGQNNTIEGINISSTGAGGDAIADGGGTVGTFALSKVAIVASDQGLVIDQGGTVSATGAGNTITTSGGTALNITNTTIAAAGMTFQSISSNGAASGIILNNTGSNAGLTVTGTGASNSGGTIENSTGNAISATSTHNLSLTSLRILNAVGHGINATNLTGSSNGFINGSISGFDSGNTATKDAIHIVNTNTNLGLYTVSGATIIGSGASNDGVFMEAQGTSNMTLSVQGSTSFTNMFGDGVQVSGIGGATGQVRVTVRDSSFTNAATFGNGGISFTPFGGINFYADVDTNTFDTIMQPVTNLGAINMTNGSTATADITVRNNTLNNILGSRGISFAADGTGLSKLHIDNNNIDRLGSNHAAINVNLINGPGHVTVTNNDIGQAATLWTGPAPYFNYALNLQTQNSATMTARVDGNTIDANTQLNPVEIQASGTSTLNVIVTNNNVEDTDGAQLGELDFFSSVNGTINADISGNNLNAGGIIAFFEGGASTINVKQTSSAALSAANGGATIDLGGTTPQFNTGNPPTPLLPSLPLLVAAGGVAAASTDTGATDAPADDAGGGDTGSSAGPGEPSTVVPAEPALDGIYVDDGVLSQQELAATVAAAIERWQASGLTEAQLDYLRGISFEISDLSGWNLAGASNGHVIIDIDAAGHGWYVDATPHDDGEFSVDNGGVLQTTPDQAAAGRVDLLSVVLHELGHELGLADTYAITAAANVMYGYISDGQRRLPAAGQAEGAIAGSIVGLDFALGTVTIGELPAGKAVTVYFDAEVNDDQSNGIMQPATSQATITADGGISILSDGDTGTAGLQVTTTPLDSLSLGNRIFVDANNNQAYDTGEGISGVALTLYADNGTTAGVYDGGDTLITTTVSGADGLYQFAGLAPGDYIVRVDQANFTAGNPLHDGTGSATSLPGQPDPDNNVDHDDNGAVTVVAGGGVVSLPITLSFNNEPTAGNGNDTNDTLDFGFIFNLPPDVTGLGGDAVTFTEGGAPVLLDDGSDTAVTDSDSADFDGGNVTVSIVAGGTAGEDVLAIVNQGTGAGQIGVSGADVSFEGTVIGTVAGGSGGVDLVVTLDTDATPAAISALIHALTYANTNTADPSGADRTVRVTVNDGDGGTSANSDVTVHVTQVNDAPVNDFVVGVHVVAEDTDLVFNAGNGNAISISDVDAGSGDLSVTLTVSNGVLTLGTIPGGLAFTTGDGTADATMTFEGTLAEINAALDGLTYRGNSNYVGADTLSIVTNDLGNTGTPGALGDSDTLDINVQPVNDAPVLTLQNGAQNVAEDTDLVFNAGNGNAITVADVDAGTGDLSVTLTVNNGVLTLSQTTGLSFSTGDGTADATMTFTGTLADINAALDGLTYRGNLNYFGGDALTITVDDQGNTGSPGPLADSDAVLIGVTAVNDAPTIPTAPASVFGTPGNAITIGGAGASQIVFADVDAGGGSVSAAFTVTQGTLAAASGGGVTVGGTATNLTLSGTITDINAFLAAGNLTYTSAISDSIHVDIDDGGNTGAGGAQNAATDIAVTVDIPPVVVADAAAAYTENAPSATVLSPTLTLTDADAPGSGNQINSATVQITGGFFTGDVLAADVTGTGITAVYNAGTQTLTLSGADTIANYQAVLRSVTFESSSDNPTNFGANPTRTVTWIVNDIHDVPSTADTTTVTVTAVNDPAALSADIRDLTETNSALDISSSGTLTISDVDDSPATFVPQAGTVGLYGTFVIGAGGAWTYTASSAHNEFVAGQTYTDTFNVESNDGTQTTVTINILGTNDPALVAGTTTGAVTEAGGVSNGTVNTPTATGTLTDTDVDNTDDTFTAVAAGAATTNGYGTFEMTAGGVWTYTLDETNAAVQALNVGDLLVDTFTVTTIDGTPQLVTVTIHGANDAAVIAGTTTGSVTEAGGVANGTVNTPTATGTLTDTDVDNADDTFTAVAAGAATVNGYGTFEMTAGGVWTYTLDENNAAVQALNVGDTLVDTFTVTTIDGTPQLVTVTINGANDAAVIAGTTTGAVTEAGGVANGTVNTPTATGTLTDTDVDNADDTFTAVAAGAATTNGYGTFGMTADGTWTYTLDENNAAVQALNVGDFLTDSFTVTTVDGTPQVVTVTINGANDAPVVTAGNAIFYDANGGGTIAVAPAIALADVDSATLSGATVQIGAGFDPLDVLNFTNQGGITGSYNAATGTLMLTGTASLATYQTALASITFFSTTQANGTRTIEWTVDDGSASGNVSAVASTTIDVKGIINRPPHHGDGPRDGHHGGGGGGGHHGFFDRVIRNFGELHRFDVGRGHAIFFVRSNVTFALSPDLNFEARVALADLAVPLNGDIATVVARLPNGDPLPDWLQFDPQTGVLSGNPPGDAVASIPGAADDEIVTALGPDDGPQPETIEIEIFAMDSKGNIAVTKVSVELSTIGSAQPITVPGTQGGLDRLDRLFGDDWHIPGDIRDAARLDGHDGGSAPAGRTGLSEQFNSHGWREMHAGRNALLASLSESAGGWR